MEAPTGNLRTLSDIVRLLVLDDLILIDLSRAETNLDWGTCTAILTESDIKAIDQSLLSTLLRAVRSDGT